MRRSVTSSSPNRITNRLDFAQELTRTRERAGLTIREIATTLGMPASTVGGYFGGAHLPKLGAPCVLARILHLCGVTDAAEVDRWRQALRQARRSPPVPAHYQGHDYRAHDAADAYRADPAVREVHAPAPLPGAAPVSTRAPVHRLAGEPRVRGRADLLARLAPHLAGAGGADDTASQGGADGGDGGVDSAAGGAVHVLYGVGGCGKSTVALALARDATARGVRTWWVGAADLAQANAGMRAVAVDLGVRPGRLRLGSMPDQLWRRLERLREPWLLIIDGADDPLGTLALPGQRVIDATGWLRPMTGPHGTVVVTSRDGSAASWGAEGSRWASLHEVAPLTDADGALVLRELAGDGAGGMEAANRLAQRLGGLPLALCAAGRFLGETARIPAGIADSGEPRTYDSYARALDQGRHRELFGHDTDAVGPIWELTLDLLEARGMPEARPMLRLLSCLGPGAIPYALLLRAPALASSPLFPGLTGRRMWTVLEALASVGLIRLRGDDSADQPTGAATEGGGAVGTATAPAAAAWAMDTLVIPRLVRETSRGHADVAGQVARYLAVVTTLLSTAVRDLDPGHPTSWARWRMLAEHCAAPLHLVSEHQLRPADTPSDVLDPAAHAAGYLRTAGHLSRAASQYSNLIPVARRLLGPDHPYVLGLRHDLCRVWYDAGQYNLAKRGLHAVAAARRALLGPDHPDTLTTHHTLARALRDHGQLDEAYARFTDVLERRRRVLGGNHLDTLLSASQVADLLRGRGRLDEAERLCRDVYAARREQLGARHPATLIGRLHLARLASARGEFDRAEAELRELLDGLRDSLGPDHPWTMTTQQALVDVWHAQGRLDEAERAAHEVLHARHRVLGYDHPATLVTRHRLGAILHDRGDLDDAEKELQAVLEARGQKLCAGHPDTTRTARRLAALRTARRQHSSM